MEYLVEYPEGDDDEQTTDDPGNRGHQVCANSVKVAGLHERDPFSHVFLPSMKIG